MVSLSHLLICANTSGYFLGLEGFEIILSAIRTGRARDSGLYYGMLSLWGLSYQKKNHRFLTTDENCFLALMLEVCRRHPCERIVRILVKILLNLLENPTSSQLIIEDGKLLLFLETFSNKTTRHESFKALMGLFLEKIKEVKNGGSLRIFFVWVELLLL